jgi:DNA-binding SARP family transcriptional activator
MRFKILGPLKVWDGAGWVVVAARQQRQVLAALLIHAGRRVSTERLVYEVWGERPPRTARKTIHAYVMRLRRLIRDRDARVLVTREQAYELAVEDLDLDSGQFERLVAAGRSELAGGRAELAAARLSQALALWDGSVLADVPDSPARAARAEELELVKLDATEDQISALMEIGRGDEAVVALHRLVREHPLRERLWALLMQLQYARGHRGEALTTYRRARRVLREELGLEPGRALQRLQREILASSSEVAMQSPPSADASGNDPG